jgi:hypothetical protein
MQEHKYNRVKLHLPALLGLGFSQTLFEQLHRVDVWTETLPKQGHMPLVFQQSQQKHGLEAPSPALIERYVHFVCTGTFQVDLPLGQESFLGRVRSPSEIGPK